MDNVELMTILDQLERDKGINKEVLIEAVESAVASAARKVWSVGEEEEVVVTLDRQTGKLSAFADGHEIRSSEFGRIAAQTAKQVVIQKIREAEKDVVYNEFKAREGQIVSGSVYRFERGSVVIDLGKTEGIIPRNEQSPKEEFKQGDRIKVYVVQVNRDTKGPQIILSRGNPFLVKRLFELEVPEIYENIVEIKSISRAVGDRTKIAVFSKDEKVDCVGACVGMRGARVKNIVSELQGEKIDIVRWSDDIKEYIQAALSPAEISQIQLDYDDKVANLIVADDQLSLAIGKRGQNVRLASELVGWELNIYTAQQWEKHEQEVEGESAGGDDKAPADGEDAVKEEAAAESQPDETAAEAGNLDKILSCDGVGPAMVASLREAGFDSLEKIVQATIEDLTQVKGLGTMKAQKLLGDVKNLLEKQ